VIPTSPTQYFEQSLIVRTSGNYLLAQTELTQDSEKKLLELAVSWNCVDGAHDLFKKIQISNDASPDRKSQDVVRKYYPSLFEQALKKNRPMFVDYFLRRYYNPLETTAFVKYRDSSKVRVE
jgi:hypothetical protein